MNNLTPLPKKVVPCDEYVRKDGKLIQCEEESVYQTNFKGDYFNLCSEHCPSWHPKSKYYNPLHKTKEPKT